MNAMARASSCRQSKFLWMLLIICALACQNLEVQAKKKKAPYKPIASVPPHTYPPPPSVNHEGRLLVLVEPPPLILDYHNGSLLTASKRAAKVIPVYLIWYGTFTSAQKSIVRDFFSSFESSSTEIISKPSVSSWWKLTSGYKDKTGVSVAGSMRVAREVTLAVKKEIVLSDEDIEELVVRSLKKLPAKSFGVYIVLTAQDILVQSFCMNSCASHFSSEKKETKGKQLPYIWVGNPASQCPGLCAWPFAQPAYGPPDFKPLVPPSGDVGMDGLIINLASMLAGIATNPFDTGYYQGDARYPLEAATACTGIYGAGSYSGYPGQVLADNTTGASYNAYGFNSREFLLPALWDHATTLCTPPPA